MKSHTFKGEKYRANLSIFDATGEHIPEEFRKEKPEFCVQVLKADAHPSTPFYRGYAAYFGDDFEHAWTVVKFYVGHQVLPHKIARKYRWETNTN